MVHVFCRRLAGYPGLLKIHESNVAGEDAVGNVVVALSDFLPRNRAEGFRYFAGRFVERLHGDLAACRSENAVVSVRIDVEPEDLAAVGGRQHGAERAAVTDSREMRGRSNSSGWGRRPGARAERKQYETGAW